MKGFPNQLAAIEKIRDALRVVVSLIDAGENAADDSILGEGLVRTRVLGAGHGGGKDIERYLAEQRLKTRSNRSHEASARGILEFLRYLGVVQPGGHGLVALPLASTLMNADPATQAGKDTWHAALLALEHRDARSASHPYAVLMRIVAELHQLPKALAPLALEASDDSDAEFQRVVNLARGGTEAAARNDTGATVATWNNAKKVLPSLAVQVDALRDTNDMLSLGPTAIGAPQPNPIAMPPARTYPARRWTGRLVSTAEAASAPFQHASDPTTTVADPAVTRALLHERSTLHQATVRALAGFLALQFGVTEVQEDPMDLLALFMGVQLLAEVKTLDGSTDDEVAQVRAAIAQLYWYGYFNTVDGVPVRMLAVFNQRPASAEVEAFLASAGIAVAWPRVDGAFCLSLTTAHMLPDHVRTAFVIV